MDKKEKILSLLDKVIGWALVVIILTIPFPRYIQTIETLCFTVIIASFITKLILRYPLKGIKIDLHVFIFTILIIISIFFSVDYLYSLHEFRKYWLRPVLLSYAIVNFAANEKNIGYLVCAVVISSIAPIAFGVMQYFTGTIRLKSMFGAPTEFGQYLDYIIPLMVSLILWNKEKISRVLLSIILIGAFFCLIFTYSRASWVAVFVAVGLVICPVMSILRVL